MWTASALDDGGVVVGGYSNGTSWNGTTSSGLSDFAAVKLDSDGTVVWRWQVSSQINFGTCARTSQHQVKGINGVLQAHARPLYFVGGCPPSTTLVQQREYSCAVAIVLYIAVAIYS